MLKNLRSYMACLKPSKMFGQAEKLASAGRKYEAENMLRVLLKLLSMPHIIRSNPAEASLILTSMMQLEELATEHGGIDASNRDVVDSLYFLQGLDRRNSPLKNHDQWLAYLQERAKEKY